MSRIAFVFPGQGAQFPGMGRSLADAFPESAEVFREADDALDKPISRLCFEGDADQLALTENTQPAILTVSVAAYRALASRGLEPVAAAGHSLGEYSAHVAAGTLSLADAVRTVRERGCFMQQAVAVGEGAMAAVIGLAPEVVERLCAEAAGRRVVAAANYNGPSQTVVAGHADAVARVVDAAPGAGALRAVPLAVSAPFHCSLMEPAATRLRPVLEKLDLRAPRFPIYTNTDAAAVTDAATARDALLRQVASPVRWQQLVSAMLDDGIDTFVEVGPGKVLSGLIRRIRKGVTTLQVQEPSDVECAVRKLEMVS